MIEIPDQNLAEIGGNKRAPLKITINGYIYQSTATAVDGQCMVVFPMRDRGAARAAAGDRITVTLELDTGYREVDVPADLHDALQSAGLSKAFHVLTYSKRKEFVRQINEAKAEQTRANRIQKVLVSLTQ